MSCFQLFSRVSLFQLEPVELVEDERFVHLAAGEGHTLAVTEHGDLFAFGRGTEGQLGHGSKGSRADAQQVDALADEVIVCCAAGSMHSLAVTASGQLYVWGLVLVAAEEASKTPAANKGLFSSRFRAY